MWLLHEIREDIYWIRDGVYLKMMNRTSVAFIFLILYIDYTLIEFQNKHHVTQLQDQSRLSFSMNITGICPATNALSYNILSDHLA